VQDRTIGHVGGQRSTARIESKRGKLRREWGEKLGIGLRSARVILSKALRIEKAHQREPLSGSASPAPADDPAARKNASASAATFMARPNQKSHL
jgi:hypothetical protein